MKKTLLSILGAMACMGAMAQTASPSWTIVQNSNFPNVSFGIRYLDAVNDSVIWATGYDGTAGNTSRAYCWVTHSTDGGNSFNFAPMFASTLTPGLGDTSTYAISNLDGIDANTCWAAAYKKAGGGSQGGIFKTTDGGATWVNKTPTGMFTNASSFANWVAFFNAKDGVAMGDPVAGEFEIWRTTDGGTTWTQVPGANIPNPTSGEFGTVNVYEKMGTSKIWFGTNKGRMLYSTDGGATWSAATINASNVVSDFSFRDAQHGLAMTYIGTTTNCAVYKTQDGGATWTLTPSDTDPSYGRNDLCAIPGTSLYASCGAGAGNYILSYSNDDGQTWQDWGSSGIQYLAVDFVSPDKGWAGSFSDATTATMEGFYKYSGPLLSNDAYAGFTPMTTTVACTPVTGTVNNFSTGSPAPSFTWATIPPAVISNSLASNPVFTFATPGSYQIILTAASGTTSSSMTKILTVYNCTGLVDNNTFLADLSIYPNPTKNLVNIEVANAGEYTIHVADMLGRTVLTEKTSNEKHAIDLSGNKSGVYILTVESKGLKTTRKIVLE